MELRSQNSMKIGNSNTDISVNRRNLFNDAYHKIMNILSYNLKNRLRITYVGEMGFDLGGLLK